MLRNVEPGELVTPGQPIVRVAELRQVWLRVYVPEPQMGRIKLGQRAEITTDTYPTKRYAGTVIEIAQQPEFTPKNVQTKGERVKLVFGVKIAIENPEQELKPGMPADAVIRVGSPTARTSS
ncbi:MAG: putative multidrug resistance protein EmrK [bacterium ADurb.Bin429]|nr:MAG: putative multidrug resistance protein EmrK [bacterium ADurb.Bin429]